MSLSELLRALEEEGCYPCISMGGKGIWRAHINGAGKYWAEGRTPKRALKRIVTFWEKAGRPMDGYAANKRIRRLAKGENKCPST